MDSIFIVYLFMNLLVLDRKRCVHGTVYNLTSTLALHPSRIIPPDKAIVLHLEEEQRATLPYFAATSFVHILSGNCAADSKEKHVKRIKTTYTA
jgi:hypothetical protein